MFTDIVGYTRIMGEDDQKALQLLRKNRSIHITLIERVKRKKAAARAQVRQIEDEFLAITKGIQNRTLGP